MGRKRLNKNEVKERISIRLKKKTIEKIKKQGTLQEVIECIVEKKFNDKDEKDT